MDVPKVVFLDWYKTLSTSVFWEHIQESNSKEYKSIIESLFVTNKGLIDPWMRGEYSSEEVTSKIAKEIKLKESFVLGHLALSARKMTFAQRGIELLIQMVRSKGIRVVIATDNMDTFNRWTVPELKLDLLVDGILNSWDLKALKKDFKGSKSGFFEKYLKESDLKPSDCMLIDDSEDKDNKIADFGIVYKRISNPGDVVTLLNALL